MLGVAGPMAPPDWRSAGSTRWALIATSCRAAMTRTCLVFVTKL